MVNPLEELKLKNIKYILSIGKRQPMHIGHKTSLERILALKDMHLVYVMGSCNLKGDPLFDPIVNPLTIEQQIKQFKKVFPEEEAIFIAIPDVPEMGKWGDVMIESLAKYKIFPKECAIHFIGKDEDRLEKDLRFTMSNGKDVFLRKGQWLIEALAFWGFTIWFDKEIKTDLRISARNLRKFDLDGNTDIFAAPKYLKELVLKARKGNPEIKGEPLTLYDLSLQRIKGE